MLSKLVPDSSRSVPKDRDSESNFKTEINILKKAQIVTDTERGTFCPIHGVGCRMTRCSMK